MIPAVSQGFLFTVKGNEMAKMFLSHFQAGTGALCVETREEQRLLFHCTKVKGVRL